MGQVFHGVVLVDHNGDAVERNGDGGEVVGILVVVERSGKVADEGGAVLNGGDGRARTGAGLLHGDAFILRHEGLAQRNCRPGSWRWNH